MGAQGLQERCWTRRIGAGFAAALSAVVLCACQTPFDVHRASLEAIHAQGQFDTAAGMLDDPRVKELYGKKNVLLYWLDRGAVALAEGDAAAAVDWLDRAESYMEVHREPTAGDEFARWLVNDTLAPYYGSSYEELYVNVLKMLAQLARGWNEGGATVEARRQAGKADVLRDRYIRTRDLVLERSDESVRRGLSTRSAGGRVDENSEGRFIESTLGAYLTAVTFMKAGDREAQRVAGRRLASAIELQPGLQPGVDARAFGDIGRRDPATANVLVVALSGRGPTKAPRRIGPIPLYQWPVYFELPELVGGSEAVAAVRVVAEDPSAAGLSPSGVLLDKVEDMRAVAMENFRREQPLIYARTLLRSSMKAAGAYAATEAVKHQAHGDSRDAAQFGMILAGLAFLALTEKADLRSWVFLPARADAALLSLPVGTHRLRAEFLSEAGGVLYAGPWGEVSMPAASGAAAEKQLVTIVDQFWN